MYPSDKSNVVAGGVVVDKLEGEQLDDEGIIVPRLCSVVL